MSDPYGFLQAIIENPYDDAPRLVYADWLEEHGDPRAEFIRVQCALAHLKADDERRPELVVREQDLLREHSDAWVGKLKPLVTGYGFCRGFIEWVSLPGRSFLTKAEELLALAPIRQLRLTRLGMGNFPAAELAVMPQLAKLIGLELAGVAGDDRINTILRSPHLKQLTRLQLDDVRYGEQTLKTILGGALARLDSLELVGDAPRDLMPLICRPKIPLREFSIKSPEGVLNRDDVIELARAKNLAKLKHLDLRNSNVQVPGATALAKSKLLAKLEVLGLKSCSIGVHGMQALASSPNLTDLRALNLEGNHFGVNGLRAIVGAPWKLLTTLNLGNNDLDDRCLLLLRDWQGLGRLRYLSLADNPFPDAALAEFLAAPELAHLWRLELDELAEEPKTAAVLANAPHLVNVRNLNTYDLGFRRTEPPSQPPSGTRINIH
jgi:uncharacterized protein (TIGR02996 family)